MTQDPEREIGFVDDVRYMLQPKALDLRPRYGKHMFVVQDPLDENRYSEIAVYPVVIEGVLRFAVFKDGERVGASYDGEWELFPAAKKGVGE